MALNTVMSGAAGTQQTTVVPAGTLAGTFVIVGGKRGLTANTARLGQNGLSYATVGTGDTIRVDNIAIAFNDGDPVYVTAATGVFSGTATGNVLVGYAYRAKSVASAPLFVVLVPGAITA